MNVFFYFFIYIHTIFSIKNTLKLDYYNDIVYSRDLTQGWNYVEVVDTMPSLSSSRYEIRASWN